MTDPTVKGIRQLVSGRGRRMRLRAKRVADAAKRLLYLNFKQNAVHELTRRKVAFWWVNQNKTLVQEISGGFMWSPKTSRNGRFNRFFENMTKVEPHDIVFSYSNQCIRYVGIVHGRAVSDKQPVEFASIPNNWGKEGWRVSVDWKVLDQPIRPRSFINELRPLLPEEYSPLTRTGKGRQVYLSAVPNEMADLLLSKIKEFGKSIPVEAETTNPSYDLRVPR